MSLILKVLKYCGLVIAAMCSVWSIITKPYIEIEGTLEITNQGMMLIVFTIIGLLLSLISTFLEDQQNTKKEKQTLAMEHKRTRAIILAGQPLSSLDIKIRCPEDLKFQQNLRQAMELRIEEHEGRLGEVSNGVGNGIARMHELPLFTSAIKGITEEDNQDFLLLITIGNSESTILSYGYLSDDLKIYQAHETDNAPALKSFKKRSKGILFYNDVNEAAYYNSDISISEPHFSIEDNSIILNWSPDPYTLAHCVDKITPQMPITANLPDTIKITMLFDILYLPFSTGNLTTADRTLWHEDDFIFMEDAHYEEKFPQKAEKHIFENSIMDITPNKLSTETLSYHLDSSYYKTIVDREYEETVLCQSLLLVYKKNISDS